MTTVYCTICGQKFETDDDHVEVSAETVWIGDRNSAEEFVFHVALLGKGLLVISKQSLNVTEGKGDAGASPDEQ